MIYCPKCGTANRDGSRFCNECGEQLGTQTRVKCPNCGAMNPIQNVFCSECRGRLMESPASSSDAEIAPTIKGISLPTKASLGGQDEEKASEATTPEPEDETPAWLRELGATLTAEGRSTKPFSMEDAAEVPDWLRDLRESLPREAESDMLPAEEPEQVPDWLSDLRPARVEPAIEPEDAPPAMEAGEEEAPDWLAELRPGAAEPAAEPEPEPPALEADEGEVPGWLAGAGAVAAAAALTPERAEEAPEADEGDMPAWLAELRPGAADKAPSAAPSWMAELQAEGPEGEAAPGEELAKAELPDWLVPSGPEPEGDESLAQAEIPDWLLALKPVELREEGEEEGPVTIPEEPVEETGLLAGLSGTLPVEMIIAQPRAVTTPAEALELAPADSPQSRLFAEIVGRPPEAAPSEIAQPRKRSLALVPRWITYLALIVAVTLPLLLGRSLLTRTIEPSAAVTDLHRTIESLGSNTPVLVAFDYDPTNSGEMDALARPIIGHLMDRGARVVVMSLLPAGPATAQPILDELAAERSEYADRYGERYVNLGYLPGEAAAIRLVGESIAAAFPRDTEGTPLADLAVMQGLASVQDFELIIELAPAQDSLRWWIEQASAPYGVSLGAGVSASVAPLVSPYYETESRQLAGMVGGVAGAAAYESLLSGQNSPPDATAARLDAQLAGQAILVLVLLIGNGAYLVQRGRQREQ